MAERAVRLAEAARRTAARWYFIAPTLFLLVVVNQLEKTNIAVIVAHRPFLADMGLVGQPGRIGFLTTVFFLGYGIGLVAWGFVVDRLGPRRSAMLGVCGWAVTTIWCAAAGSASELYAARFVLGVTEGCIWPVCNSYSARWFPVDEHGRIQSVWVNGNQVGVALGLPVVVALISLGGWRTVFWALGAGSFILLQPLLLFLAPDEPQRSPYTNEEERRYIEEHRARAASPAGTEPAKLGLVLRDPRFWLVTGCHVGTVATLFGLAAWIPTYLTQVRGVPFHSLRGWVALSYLLPIAVSLALGWLADRTRRPAMVGLVTGAAVAAMVLGAVTVPNTVLSVLLLVTALAQPMITGAMNATLIHGLAPPEQIGRSTGLFVGLSNPVGGVAPTFIGYLIGLFGGRYLVPFGFVSAVNVVMVVLYWMLDRRRT